MASHGPLSDQEKETMSHQLDEISLIRAMYSLDDCVSMNEADELLYERLRDWMDSPGVDLPSPPQTALSLGLRLDIPDVDDGEPTGKSLDLDLVFPIVDRADGDNIQLYTDRPPVKVRIRQPPWLSKAESTRLSESVPDSPEDTLATLDHIKDAASRHLAEAQNAETAADTEAEPLTRVWFYFPSISTRAKRDDIVNYAPSYKLTGFLLAGKPGLLCLEGGAQAIDDYMKFIKTESWGDIPSQHKKVSERHRESVDVSRAFPDMQEISDTLGERRGERANRNDMKALEAWLERHGVGEVFDKIFM